MVKVGLRSGAIQEVKEGPYNDGRTMCGCRERESTCVCLREVNVCLKGCVCVCVNV